MQYLGHPHSTWEVFEACWHRRGLTPPPAWHVGVPRTLDIRGCVYLSPRGPCELLPGSSWMPSPHNWELLRRRLPHSERCEGLDYENVRIPRMSG